MSSSAITRQVARPVPLPAHLTKVRSEWRTSQAPASVERHTSLINQPQRAASLASLTERGRPAMTRRISPTWTVANERRWDG